MAYELWSTETSNLLADYDTVDAALDAVGRVLREHGPDYVSTLLLGHEDKRGRSRLIATGDDLIARARVHSSETVATA